MAGCLAFDQSAGVRLPYGICHYAHRSCRTDTGPRVAEMPAGSTDARGPAELLRGTWAFQLWHSTERRCWWGRRSASGGLEWCHRRSRPDDESVAILDPPLEGGGALPWCLSTRSDGERRTKPFLPPSVELENQGKARRLCSRRHGAAKSGVTILPYVLGLEARSQGAMRKSGSANLNGSVLLHEVGAQGACGLTQ